jgi:hypothetical protein
MGPDYFTPSVRLSISFDTRPYWQEEQKASVLSELEATFRDPDKTFEHYQQETHKKIEKETWKWKRKRGIT